MLTFQCIVNRAPTGPGILEKSWNLENNVTGPGKVQEFENPGILNLLKFLTSSPNF